MQLAEHILECRERWLAKLAASGRLQTSRGKAKRKHPKRHGENRERSRMDRQKAKKAKLAQDAYTVEYKRRSAIMRAYFRGDIPDLSSI